MLFKGYKIRVRCLNWEQVDYLDEYWAFVAQFTTYDKLIGLGYQWSEDHLYFNYALGVFEDEETLQKIKAIDFSKSKFIPEYVEISLPNIEEWENFHAKVDQVKELYTDQVDCYHKNYDYELEYIDELGNYKVQIHFI